MSNASCNDPSAEELREIQGLVSSTDIIAKVIVCSALATGLPGSLLTLITFCKMTLSPATFYICVLAVSDAASLLFFSVAILLLQGTEVSSVSLLIGNVFQGFSSWILVLICLERFVSVRFPFKKSTVYTIKNTVISSCVVFLFNSIPPVADGVWEFSYHYASLSLEMFVMTMYTVTHGLLPGCLIVLFTALTAFFLRRSVQRREQLTSSAFRQSRRMETELTRIMFLTAFCFVLFVLPLVCLCLAIITRSQTTHYIDTLCPMDITKFTFVMLTSETFRFFNNSVNLYIYLACSRQFRNRCFGLITCKKREAGTLQSQTTISRS